MTTRTKLVQISMVLVLVLGAFGAEAAERASKKLWVFILAGQSNMVGHANYITIPRLFADERTEVQGLEKLVFKPNMKVMRATVDKQIATKIERDAINNKLRKKEIEGADQIAAARKAMAALQADYDKQTQAIKNTFAVSDSVYISSVADNSRKSGPLTVGYGGNGDKIGPELGFGMSLAQKIDAPILIIKTSWGGKSLHYNFRPPSAGSYELNEKEAASDKAADIAWLNGNRRLWTGPAAAKYWNIIQPIFRYTVVCGYGHAILSESATCKQNIFVKENKSLLNAQVYSAMEPAQKTLLSGEHVFKISVASPGLGVQYVPYRRSMPIVEPGTSRLAKPTFKTVTRSARLSAISKSI